MVRETHYLETLLTNYYAQKEPRERTKLSASDTGCNLHTQLKMWGVKPDREQSLAESMNFDLGNMIHLFLQERLKKAGMEDGLDEYELEDDVFMAHPDKISLEDGKYIVNEFKSIKDYAMDVPQLAELPKVEHIKQTTNYVRMLKAKMGDDKVSNEFRIFYLAKCFDDSHRKFLYSKRDPELAEGKTIIRLKEFTVDYDATLAESIVIEGMQIINNIQNKTVMPCSMWGTNWHRSGQYNQYLSWCSLSQQDMDLLQDRIEKEDIKNGKS